MWFPRKKFLIGFFGGFLAPFGIPLINLLRAKRRVKNYLRPPGALEESQFLSACIGCAQCANVCPNDCIRFYGLEKGLAYLGTPYIDARAKGCILCMACNQVCPTGALVPLPKTEQGMLMVKMGKAHVLKDYCYSYAGRTCGVCYKACPLPGKAMTLGLYETPIVHKEYCVGCGLCEQACVHMPQAIRVTPSYLL
ncbi:MAG: 4Fe-4S dicluster domain-containing protein [Candidatus Hydrogenedentota bacterium]|nr:MAG: 4Fe-4S dicluster domain-containing protein [Candidatus Hydrogenedentota bacterium]